MENLEIWKSLQYWTKDNELLKFKHYEISSLGRVRSLERKVKTSESNSGYRNQKGQLRVPSLRNRYMSVIVSKEDGSCKNLRIGRAVASSFLTKTFEQTEVNHINKNKLDDSLTNLEWVTKAENIKHRDTFKPAESLKGEAHPTAKFTNQDILTIRELCKTKTNKALASMFGTTPGYIRHIKTRRVWKHI